MLIQGFKFGLRFDINIDLNLRIIIYYNLKMHNSQEQFRSKREQFTTEIRRMNREEILAKRRNINAQSQQPTQQSTTNSTQHIIDPRFADKIKQFQAVKPNRQDFIQYIKSIHDPDPLTQHYGLIQIRKMLTQKKNPPIQQVIDAGLIPRLISYAQQAEYPQLQLQAAWCLTNVAAGNTKQTSTIIDRQGIKIFVDLLLSPHVGIVQQAVWALGNIACDSPNYRDGIVKIGGLKNLIRVVEIGMAELSKNPSIIDLIQSAIWSISGICRTQPIPNYLLIKQALPVFFTSITHSLIKDITILGNICWAISYYTNKQKEGPTKIDKIQNCIDSGVLPHIIQYLGHTYDNLVIACLKIVGNIAYGTEQQSAVLFGLGLLPKLEGLLGKAKKVYRRDSCWVLSNLTAGPHQQIQAVFSRQTMVAKLLQMLKSDLPDIQAQICYIFSNSTQNGNPQKIFAFLNQTQYISHLAQIIRSTQDINLLKTALQCLQVILYFGKQIGKKDKSNFYVKQLYRLKIVQKLEELQYHDEDKIYQEVSKILYGYFELIDPLCL